MMKLWLTPLCFLGILLFYFVVGVLGLSLYRAVFWIGAAVLTLLGAYCTKHLPDPEENAC